MLLRSAVSSVALRAQRSFHTSNAWRNDNTTHYTTLQVPNNASPSDIKKSFYRLSKNHHPDRNRNDPNSSSRFVKISEAYAVLGHPEKRLRYDRDIMRMGHGTSHGNVAPKGSYHSSGPAGGRPASGLSRRRTQFRSPPPSFYRSGGWGSQSTKRRAAQDETSYTNQGGAGGHARTALGGGTGPGQQPFGSDNDVPHFDRAAHFRTHNNQEQRRQRKVSDGYIPTGPEGSTLGNFVFIGSIISLGVLIPSLLFERMARNNKTEK